MPPISYTLRVNKRPNNNFRFKDLDSAPPLKVGSVKVTAKCVGSELILQASEFESEIAAINFLPKVKSALWNLALVYGISFDPAFAQHVIVRSEGLSTEALATSLGMNTEGHLTPIHGLACGGDYAIYDTNETIVFPIFGGLAAQQSIGWERLFDALLHGMTSEPPESTDTGHKLETAMDLYLSSFQEHTLRARFLSLVTALEVLAPDIDKHTASIELINSLHLQIEEKLRLEKDRAVRAELHALKQETNFRKGISIGKRIRRLIDLEIPLKNDDREVLARDVEEAYKLRSTALHNGSIDDFEELGRAHNTVLEAVRLLFKAKLGLIETQ